MANENMYYADNNGRGQATPLKIIIGDYEISMAGDNSCGALPVLGRLDIAVYKGDESQPIENLYGPDFDDLAALVKKYRQLATLEELKRGLECENGNPCIMSDVQHRICGVHAQFVKVTSALSA